MGSQNHVRSIEYLNFFTYGSLEILNSYVQIRICIHVSWLVLRGIKLWYIILWLAFMNLKKNKIICSDFTQPFECNKLHPWFSYWALSYLAPQIFVFPPPSRVWADTFQSPLGELLHFNRCFGFHEFIPITFLQSFSQPALRGWSSYEGGKIIRM